MAKPRNDLVFDIAGKLGDSGPSLLPIYPFLFPFLGHKRAAQIVFPIFSFDSGKKSQ